MKNLIVSWLALICCGVAAAQSLQIAGATFKLGMSKPEIEQLAANYRIQVVSGPGAVLFVSGESAPYAHIFLDNQDRARSISKIVETFRGSTAGMDVLRTIFALLDQSKRRVGAGPVVSLETRRVPNALTREIIVFTFGFYFVELSMDQGYGSVTKSEAITVSEGVELVDETFAPLGSASASHGRTSAMRTDSVPAEWGAGDYLRNTEERAATSPNVRACSIGSMAKLAFDAGDMAKAERYAREALQANPDACLLIVGDPFHDGNMVLGRIALKRGDTSAAKRYLLAAGRTKGTVISRQFGPNMSLADDLVQKGELNVVIEYLVLCRRFMTGNQDRIDGWIATLRGGAKPDLAISLAN